jgi:hypothetical protein
MQVEEKEEMPIFFVSDFEQVFPRPVLVIPPMSQPTKHEGTAKFLQVFNS